ncbi:hypothetical protein KSS87_001790 [Heliosperma pusillum]|nr:hypothetical protein KSS87_001790 [Heliosperma pusillum]
MDNENQAGLPLPPTGRPQTTSFSHDLSRMPENPPKNAGHRRAHSEILTLPEDINFDGDLGVVGGGDDGGDVDGPSFSDDTEEDMFSMYIDMDKVNSATSSGFELGDTTSSSSRGRHQHSQSMDGSTTMFNCEVSQAEAKKAMSAAKLAELALIDPKRAKRIWANRQSAARSKERKMRYIAELERKVQTLQTEATSLSAQLTLLQRDANGLTCENSELKIRLQTVEHQVHLQDAMNDALREDIQHLKMLTGQGMSNGGTTMNFPASFGANQPFYPNNQTMNTLFTAQQFQQLQIHSQKKQQQQQQQFQHHQLHQLQQQQHQHPDPIYPTQLPADYKTRPIMPLSKENSLESKPGMSKD